MSDSLTTWSPPRVRYAPAPARDARPPTERALVERAIQRDRAAFGQLYDQFSDRIYRYVYHKIGSRTEAEDLTAQVFMKAWEAMSRYRWTERPFEAWLYSIAHNAIVDHFRMRRHAFSLEEFPHMAQPEAGLEELTEQYLNAEILRQAMTFLTDDQQEVVILRFLEGYNTEEVAQIMERQPGAIRTLQHRALVKLCRVLSLHPYLHFGSETHESA